jgi:glycosyltransferase involved in cell wall biosynthesis
MKHETSRPLHGRSGTSASASPVRVLHVAEYIKGGIATYLDAVLAHRAATSGPESVALIVPEAEIDQVHPPQGVRVETYRYGGRGPISLLRLMWSLRKGIREIRPDIVHIHSSFPGFAARLPMMLTGRRPICIYCAHGWSFEMEMASWKRAVFAFIERFLNRTTDAIVNISMSDHRVSLQSGFDESRCVYIPNGVDFTDSVDSGDDVPLDDAVINLLFVGRFDRQKGIDLLMDAMAELNDEPLYLYVAGEAVLGGAEIVPSANVKFLGWRPRNTLQDLFARADAVVMPSRWEGFGMVAIESMCCGTAVIASNRGALPELILDGETGIIFDLDDPDGLVESLKNLDKAVLQSMGRRGRERYLSYFTAKVMNERLDVLYDALADGRDAAEARDVIAQMETRARKDDRQESSKSGATAS